MHNLYFPWIRLLLLFGFCGLAYWSKLLLEEPNYEIREEDILAYQEFHKSRIADIHYSVNGSDRKFGNLVALEPVLHPLDYLSRENFQSALEPLFQKLESERGIDRKTLVILPEHIGTGLLLLGQKRNVFFAKNPNEVLAKFVILPLGRESEDQDSSPERGWKFLFQSQKYQMATVYHSTMSTLARKYNVSILAGTIILPNPKLDRGELIPGDGDLVNVAVTYLPSGKATGPLVEKVHLTDWEKSFLKEGKPNQDFIVSVPGWKVGVAIGQDSFFPTVYKSIGSSKIDGMVSPAAHLENWEDAPSTNLLEEWKSQSLDYKSQEPADLWLNQSLTKRIQSTRGKEAVQVFLKGKGWGLESFGESYTNHEFDQIDRPKKNGKPKILNLYF